MVICIKISPQDGIPKILLLSLLVARKRKAQALNANVLNFVFFLFFYYANKLKMVSRFPFKSLSSSYFSIHHTGEINAKESLFFLSCLLQISEMLFPPQVFVVLSLKKNMQEAGCVCVCVL